MTDTITGSTIAARYRITGLYRTGRMGDTYVARRLDDGALVCVKLLDPAFFDQRERVKRFERELRITRSILHPATLSVLDAGREERGPFLVTEYVEGDALVDLLAEQGALAADRAARIAARIASALQAAHNVGVIHRDLAPTNVLVTQNDGVKVTDFGLSVLTEPDPSGGDDLTMTGVKIGTPWYMAPEYIDASQLDPRSDLYGLGVVLYEMLTGTRPYLGKPYEVMDMHVEAPVPHPQAKAGAVPGWLDALTVQLMAKEPSMRPSAAADVIRRIEEGLGETVVARMAPRPVTEPAASPDSSTLVRRLIAQHLVRGPEPVPAALERQQTFVVQRVAQPSVAHQAGWRPGWRIVLPDEPSPGLLDPQLPVLPDTRRYVAFAPGQTTQASQIVTTGADPGATLVRSVDNVQAAYDPDAPEPGALFDLWAQARYDTLEELCEATLNGARPSPAALVMKGAAQYERGRHGEGLRWIQDFHDHHAATAQARFRAVAHLYLGLDRLQFGHRSAAAEHFRHGAVLGRLPAAARRYEEITGSRPDITPWVGRRFAGATLPDQDTGRPIDLAADCQRLGEDQLLLVAFVGSRRRTADHASFLRLLQRQLRGFGDLIVEAMIVTAVHDDDPEEDDHPADAALRTAQLDVTWMVDPAAQLHRAVHPANLPTGYLLDASFVCRYQGPLTGVSLWEAFTSR